MIKGQLIGAAFDAAVLATVFVTGEDVCTGEFNGVVGFPDSDQIKKSYNRREFDGDRETMNFLIVNFQHLNLTLPQQRDGLLPVYYTDRFIGGVKEQGMFHGYIL